MIRGILGKGKGRRIIGRVTFVILGFALTALGLLTGCRGVPFNPVTARRSQALIQNREGIAAFEREEYELAEDKLEAAIKNNDDDLSSRRYYAETLWKQGKRNESLHALMEVAKRDGSPDEVLAINRSIAEKLLTVAQPMAALNYSETVIRLDPKRPEGWALRGNVNWQLGKTEEALADYHKALHFAPDDRDLLWQMAILESQAGLNDRSLATWEHLARCYTGNRQPAEILCGQGFACQKLGRIQEATEFYAAALRQKPEQIEIYSLLAELHLKNNDPVAADEVAARALALFPGNADIQTLAQRMKQVRMTAESNPLPNLR